MNKKSLFFWFAAFVCAALIFTGCPQEPDESTPGTKPTVVSAGAIAGVTVPVKSAAPVSEVTATDEYTGTVTWDGTLTDGKFAANTAYTATITLSAKEGYTFAGFEGAFTVAGVDDTEDDDGFTDGLKQAAGTGENEGKWVVTAVFPATLATDPAVVSAGAIAGVTAPATGETPVDTVTAGTGYTGTVTWDGTLTDSKFAASTVYTATIVLTATPPAQYTFAGFEGVFTVAGVNADKDNDGFTDGLKQAAGTGENEGKWVVTAVFPATANNPLADANALVGVGGALHDKATASGATLTLTDDVPVGTGTLAIPTGVTLVVPDDKTVTVSNGATLDVDGIVSVAGTFTVEGAIEVAGTLTLADGADGELKGTITVKSGGVSKDLKSGGGALWKDAGSTGKYVFEAGAKAYVGGEDDDGDLLIGASTDATAVIRLESGTFSNSQTNYTLDGVATGRGQQGEQPPENKYLFISGDMTFTIKAGCELKITGVSESDRSVLGIMVTDSNKPVVTGEPATDGKAAAKIVLGQYGFIDFFDSSGNYSSDASNIDHNFYNNSGVKETNSGLNNKTYTWTADADNAGETTPGWKAGS